MSKTPSELSAAAARLVYGRRVVVGLSGGVDSVTLLHLLVRGGADVRAAHVDHGLRAESVDDDAFCADVAANLGISFAHARLQIERGNSTQGRARIQRYAALIRLATELGGDLLAVAHHADDAWESSELQIARGAGAIGASGPTLWSDWFGFDLVRPLLGVRRRTIEETASSLGLTWREDPSNNDRSYARTRVRAEGGFDAELLARRRDAAAALAAAATLESTRTPTTATFHRDALGALSEEARARVLLDMARELHGELPAPLVEELSAAVVDSSRAPRWYCGRRIAVNVSSHEVTLHATRGQGTRLLDAQATPTLDLTEPGVLPWFGREIEVTADLVGLTLRGPRSGDQLDGEPVSSVLARLGVPAGERWRWPCLYDGDACVATLSTANELLQTF